MVQWKKDSSQHRKETKMQIQKFSLQTVRQGMIPITRQLEKVLAESQVQSGLLVVYCPHTTAAITINENADPDVVHDMLKGLEEAFPQRREYRHLEGNSPAHLKASNLGASVTLLIQDGALLLGRWQGVYFCEFDGPRTRSYYVKILED